ncbi:MAG: alpha/beta hydrolase [Deltaproteobacteria bacterium]|nr:alpha/beta hydrolase [Deltaproteobacteria bacterium]
MIVDDEVRVEGRRAVFRRMRGRSALPLVLVPGCGRDHHDFDPLLEQLADIDSDVDVVVLALPGRAGTPGPPPSSPSAAAAFVRAMLRALSIERALIGGHSYGGGIAIETALVDVDGLVAGLFLLSTGARLRVHPALLESVEAAGELVALADWRSCDSFDRIADVERISVPTVVVAGADDVLTPPRYARLLHERIAGSQLFVVDGAGHELPTTHPAAVAAALAPLLCLDR